MCDIWWCILVNRV